MRTSLLLLTLLILSDGASSQSFFVVYSKKYEPGLFHYQMEEGATLYSQGLRLHSVGDFSAAKERLESAMIQSHLYYGVHNPFQLAIIDWLIACSIQQEHWSEVERLHRFYLLIVQVNFGERSSEALHATIRMAKWHRAKENYTDAMFDYEQAIGILRDLEEVSVSARARQLGIKEYNVRKETLQHALSSHADTMSLILFYSNS